MEKELINYQAQKQDEKLMALRKKRIYLACFLLFYLASLIYFYYTYVPLIKSYQLVLIPLLLALLLLTMIRLERGLLFFLFLLPLTGNLPYYFGLYENVPQAQVGLILFLFFLLGYFLQLIIFDRVNYGRKNKLVFQEFRHPLKPYLIIFIALVFISGLIAFLRYANFFPFLSDGLPELVVNALGVRAGGARMSVLFSAFNMASGPILSLILFPFLLNPGFRRQAFLAFFLSFFLSIIIGTAQFILSPHFGQLPKWHLIGQFHATYNDPNTYGFYLAAILPLCLLLLGINQREISLKKVVIIPAILLSVFHLATCGARSAFLASLLAILFVFISFLIQPGLSRRQKVLSWIVLGSLIILFFLLFLIFETALYSRLSLSLKNLNEPSLANLFTGKLTLWSIAWKMFTDFPLSGVGVGVYIIELPNYALTRERSIPVTDSAENIFLQVLSELGLFGFLAILVIGLKILIWVKKALVKTKDFQERIIILGFVGSLLACLVNFLFHSFIGSFAAKYLFWFLLTWLLIKLNLIEKLRNQPASNRGNHGFQMPFPNPVRNESTSPKKSIKPFSFAIALILVIFTAANLAISWKSLSIPERTKKFGWSQDYGFYNWEKDKRGMDFRWAKKEAGLRIKVLGLKIGLLVHASHPNIEKNPVELKIYLADDWFRKKKLLRTFEFKDRSWHRLEIPINGVDGTNFINFRFEASRDWHPGRTLNIPDPRKISFALAEIFFIYPSSLGEKDFIILKSLPNIQWTGNQGEVLATSGRANLSFFIEEDNCWLRLKVRGQKALDLGPFIKIFLDEELIGQTLLETEDWTFLYLTFPLKAGQHTLKVEFTNDFYDPSLNQDRNLFLDEVAIIRPYGK